MIKQHPSDAPPTCDPGLFICTIGLAAFSCSLLLYFFHADFLAFAAFALIASIPLFVSCCANNRAETAVAIGSIVGFLFLRKDLSDFSFVVGDASAYTWDAIRALERGDTRGLFPPLSSALSAVSYSFFNLKEIAAINVLASLASACALFLLFSRLTGERAVAFACALFFSVQPLSVWFSKTTFSETSWQTLILLSILSLQQFSEKHASWAAAAVLSGLLAISNFSRGSAPFIFAAFLISAFSFHHIPIRQRTFTSVLMAVLFIITLTLSLYLRESYLIDWQYSKIIKDITAADVVLIAICLTGAAILTLSQLSTRVRRETYNIIVVTIMLCFKVACAAGLSILGRGDFFDLLALNELSFSIENFGYAGTLIALFGLGLIVRMTLAGDPRHVILLGIYCFGSAPFSLIDVDADRPHELYLYFSRYFFSDIFIVYLISICLGSYILARDYIIPYLSRFSMGVRFLESTVFLILLACVVNWPVLRYVSSNGYLQGSANVFEFIGDTSIGQKVTIFASDDPLYGRYDSAFLLGRVADMIAGAEIVKSVSNDAVDLGMIRGSNYRVICVNLPSCDSEPDLHYVASMAESITWATQAGGYSDRSPRQFFWDVKAFDYCAPFQFGTEIPVAKDVARCMLVQGIFGEGWYGVEATHVWSSDEAVLSIPHVDGCSSLPCELRIEFVPFAASKERPVTLTIGTGGRNQTYTFTDQGKKTVAVPLPSPRSSGAVDGGVATRDSRVDVALHVDNAISPRELGRSADPRTLGISLTGIGVFSISKPH